MFLPTVYNLTKEAKKDSGGIHYYANAYTVKLKTFTQTATENTMCIYKS